MLLPLAEMVVDRVELRLGRRAPVHAVPQLILDGEAARGVVSGRGPASCCSDTRLALNSLPSLPIKTSISYPSRSTIGEVGEISTGKWKGVRERT